MERVGVPEVFCRVLNRVVDGGYCAFICELPEMEKKIVFNPFRGIFTGCRFSIEDLKSPLISLRIEKFTGLKPSDTKKELVGNKGVEV